MRGTILDEEDDDDDGDDDGRGDGDIDGVDDDDDDDDIHCDNFVPSCSGDDGDDGDGGNDAFFHVTAVVVSMAKTVGGRGGGYFSIRSVSILHVRGEVSNLKRLVFFFFSARCMLYAKFWAS